MERHEGTAGVDAPEVDHDRAVGELAHRDRHDVVFDDVGPLGEQGGEGRRAHGTEHGGRRPAGVVRTRLGPTERGLAPVDDLDEVVGLGVARRRRLPLGGPLEPCPVGAGHLDGPVRVVDGNLGQKARFGGRSAVTRAVPVVEEPDDVVPAGPDMRGEVGRLVVALIGVGEAGARVDQGTVHPQVVLVGSRDVRGGADDR